MEKRWFITAVLVIFSAYTMKLEAQSSSGKTYSKQEAKKWFKEKAWLQGVPLTPHSSVNQQEFARQYALNRPYWDKAFAFLRSHDLPALAKGKYPIDGDNVYASVTVDSSKNFEKTNWESHRKYIDVQCIITGDEKMGVYPVEKATVIKPYDEKKDVANYSADGKYYIGKAGTFFVFFPGDAHRPNITPGGNKPVKKLVIKVKVADLPAAASL
jgi:YhcH/YjgK/YiaL family protein